MKIYNSARNVLGIAFLFIALSACSRKVQFMQSNVVPAAEGSVKIKKDKNKNYAINLKIENLAEADKLTPSKRNYMVWMESARNEVKSLGQLSSSTGLFSNKLKASLSTVTPVAPTRIFITAEDNASIAYPYGQTVLTTRQF